MWFLIPRLIKVIEGIGENLTQPFVWHINALMQVKCNSIANALELRLSCTNPLIWAVMPMYSTQYAASPDWFLLI